MEKKTKTAEDTRGSRSSEEPQTREPNHGLNLPGTFSVRRTGLDFEPNCLKALTDSTLYLSAPIAVTSHRGEARAVNFGQTGWLLSRDTKQIPHGKFHREENPVLKTRPFFFFFP